MTNEYGMVDYTVYSTEGKFLRSGSCMVPDLKNQAGEGEYVIEGADDEPPPSDEEIYENLELELRSRRNMLLALSDWTQLPDAPLEKFEKEAWANYRQKLRDIPQVTDDFDSIDWPIKPGDHL